MLPPKVKKRFGTPIQKTITVYADEPQWNDIIGLMPNFVSRAHELFGSDLPHVKFYLFARYVDFARHYSQLVGCQRPSGQVATGNLGIVIASMTNSRNQIVNRPSVIMHEYGHALCNTIYGPDYLSKIPSWLNEGIADYAAMPWYSDTYEWRRQIIRDEAAKERVPIYEELSGDFFKYPHAAYSVAALMVCELLREHESRMILQILHVARQCNGAFAEVIQQFALVSSRDLYEKVLNSCNVATISKRPSPPFTWTREPANEKFWRQIIDQWHASGTSARKFAAVAGVSEESLYGWRKELALRDSDRQNGIT